MWPMPSAATFFALLTCDFSADTLLTAPSLSISEDVASSSSSILKYSGLARVSPIYLNIA